MGRTRRPRPDVPEIVTWVTDHGLAALGLIGLVIYGIVRAGHEQFYGQVGLTPEEVGLDQAEILGRAALGLFFFFAVGMLGATVLAFVLVGFARPMVQGWNRTALGRAWWMAFVLAVGQLLLLVPALLFVADLVAETRRADWLVPVLRYGGPLVGFVVSVAWLTAHLRHGASAATGGDPDPAGEVLINARVGVFLIALVAAGALLMSGYVGARSGQEMKKGEPLPHPWLLRPAMMSIRAGCVRVNWLGDERPENYQHNESLRFLGEKDGMFVLYRSGEQGGEWLRLPVGQVAMTSVPVRECKPVVRPG
jgi:hypothetical protein